MQLNHIIGNTYYIDNASNIGVYVYEHPNAILIDSGIDKDTAKKILKLTSQAGLKITHIFNTHYHADHIGGNAYIKKELLGVKVIAPEKEVVFIENPMLEPMCLMGGKPSKDYMSKFFMATPCRVHDFAEIYPIDGIDPVELHGHTQAMLGYMTADGVLFVGDSIVSNEIIEKHPVSYTYDINEQLKTLEKLKNINATKYVLSHGTVYDDIKDIINNNEKALKNLINCVKEELENAPTLEQIQTKVFNKFQIKMNKMQYKLIGSTIINTLTALIETNQCQMQPTEEGTMRYIKG